VCCQLEFGLDLMHSEVTWLTQPLNGLYQQWRQPGLSMHRGSVDHLSGINPTYTI
jgi:hypothetical protein